MQYYNSGSILRMKHFHFISNKIKINFQRFIILSKKKDIIIIVIKYYNNSKHLSSYFNIAIQNSVERQILKLLKIFHLLSIKVFILLIRDSRTCSAWFKYDVMNGTSMEYTMYLEMSDYYFIINLIWNLPH